MKRWEYTLAQIGDVAEMNVMVADGWELCAVIDGKGWFKRDSIARQLHEQREEA